MPSLRSFSSSRTSTYSLLVRFCPAFVLCLAVLALVLLPGTASAQVATGQQVNGQTNVPAPGVGHNDIHLLSESVNLATGTVSLTVQQPYRLGGRFPNPVPFNSLGTPPFHVGLSQYGQVDLEPTLQTGATSAIPMATWSESSFTPPQNPNPNAPAQVQCNFATAFTFTDRFGVSHNLGLGVVAKAVNTNGNGPCLAGQVAIPFGNDGYVWAAFTSTQNTLTQVGAWSSTPPQVPAGPVGGFTVTDTNGVTYTFSGDCGSQESPGTCFEYGNMEDRNGNYPGPGNINDLTYPSVPKPPTTAVNYSLSNQSVANSIYNGAGEAIVGPTISLSVNGSVPAWQEVAMPNGVPSYL